jgi:hypothetical protein
VPVTQPVPETLMVVAVLASIRTATGAGANVAVTAIGPLMVSDRGFAVPLALPLQPANWYPVAGVAVRLTVEPAA